MEYESSISIYSRSFEDMRDAVNVIMEKHGKMNAFVWRSIPSYDESDKAIYCCEMDSILFWTPEDRECENAMDRISRILGKDGYAMLRMNNSVSPDYYDYKITTPGGSCKSGFNDDNKYNEYKDLKEYYPKELLDEISKASIDGYKELWSKGRQPEPPLPYKRETKPARTHDQVVQDDYLYRKSEESVEAFRTLILNKKNLEGTYEKFRKAFDALKDTPFMGKEIACIIPKGNPIYQNSLYEKLPLQARLEKAEQFSFHGKIFHIHSGSNTIQFQSVDIEPEMKNLLAAAEEDLRLAIARRGGIIDDYDYSSGKLRYVDCCVMVDNEDQRYWNWTDKFSSTIRDFGMEVITRMAIWYAIIHTPELSMEERQALQEGTFYLDAIERRNSKVQEDEARLAAEAEERGRQYELQRDKDYEAIMNLVKDKYSSVKAANFAQIEKEVSLDSFTALSYWNAFKKYLSEKFGTTPAAHFKNEGVIGKATAKPASETKKEAVIKEEPKKPAELKKPAEPPKPIDPPKPAKPKKPVEPPKPVEPKKPVEPLKPAEPEKPAIPQESAEPLTPKPTPKLAPKPVPKPAPAPPNPSEPLTLRTGNKTALGQLSAAEKAFTGTVIVESGIKEIRGSAFDSAQLKKVVLPSSLRIIREGAFYGCVNLEEVVIPNGLEEIRWLAFGNTPKLKDIKLPDSIQKVDKEAFIRNKDDIKAHICIHLSDKAAKNLTVVLKDTPYAARFYVNNKPYDSLDIYKKQEQEKEKARARADAQRIIQDIEERAQKREKAEAIQNQIRQLTQEMVSLKGIFSWFKRKKLKQQIDELTEQLRRL